jgi:hypothetical protein
MEYAGATDNRSSDLIAPSSPKMGAGASGKPGAVKMPREWLDIRRGLGKLRQIRAAALARLSLDEPDRRSSCRDRN